MKKTILYTVCLFVLTVTGCDKTVLEFPEGEGADPTLVRMNLSLEVDPSIELYTLSRSKTAGTDENPPCTLDRRSVPRRNRRRSRRTPRFVLRQGRGRQTYHTNLDPLHAARYHVVAWADYVDKGSTEDKYYTIGSLSSIRIPEPEEYIGDEEHKDAYVGRQAFDLTVYRDRWNETAECAITLRTPNGTNRVHHHRRR